MNSLTVHDAAVFLAVILVLVQGLERVAAHFKYAAVAAKLDTAHTVLGAVDAALETHPQGESVRDAVAVEIAKAGVSLAHPVAQAVVGSPPPQT
jgi:hypothetical protein